MGVIWNTSGVPKQWVNFNQTVIDKDKVLQYKRDNIESCWDKPDNIMMQKQ